MKTNKELNKLKVIHVNNVAYVASYLVQGLRNLGVEARLYQPTVGTYKSPKLKRLLLPIIRTRESFHLKRIVKNQRIDIVHIHYASFAYMAMISGLPFVLHCHGSDIIRDLHRPGMGELIKSALRKARIVFCSTPDLVPLIKTYRSDVIFLPNPIDTDLFSPLNSAETNTNHLLSISKLDRYKGLEQIIDTIKFVLQSKPDAKIGMFTFGSEAELIRNFIEQNRSNLNLIPFTPHEHMPRLINSYQVVLGQQVMERKALGVSELEAMACEKPVICPFGYADFYPEPPPLLQSNSSEEACNHAIRLFEDFESRIEIGTKSRQWILDYHSINIVTQKLLDYYLSD